MKSFVVDEVIQQRAIARRVAHEQQFVEVMTPIELAEKRHAQRRLREQPRAFGFWPAIIRREQSGPSASSQGRAGPL